MSVDALFAPFQLKSLRLPNRVVMAPMTRSFSPGGVPTPEVAAYYRRRAQGQVGLIVTEGTVVERPAASNDPNVPHFYGDVALAGWKRVVEETHAGGGVIAPQLWHVGSIRNARTEWRPATPFESPSGLSGPGKRYGEGMSEEDVADTIAAFARGAADAQRLGFDCVELHGAHGYLIDQFLWQGVNERSDGFGGANIGQRARFAAEIVAAVRAAVGEDFVIILRLSQWKQQDFTARLAHTPAEMSAWLTPLAEAGVDIFHCSQRRFWESEFPELAGDEATLNFAGWAKKLTGKASITVGSVGLSGDFINSYTGEGSKPASLDELMRRLEREEFDLVGVGRALLSDADWVGKVREGRTGELMDYDVRALQTLA